MTWVRKQRVLAHRCERPMREVVYQIPPMLVAAGQQVNTEHREVVPDGRIGDLWRCPCGALWRIGDACDVCDRLGEWRAHPGYHTLGVVWRPATLWQRIRYWKRGQS